LRKSPINNLKSEIYNQTGVPMAVRAVIWDMGGVLLRTENYTSRERLAKRLGLRRKDLEELVFWGDSGNRAQLGEITIDQHWENLRQQFNLSHQAMVDFKEDFWGGDRVDMDLIGYIRSLRTCYKTGLLSNAFSNLRQVISEVWKFADAFDEMIISAEVGLVKPDDRIYRLALERLGVTAEETVFIDDFSRNIEGARRLNIQAIHFKSSQQVLAELEEVLKGGRS
jgi:epoxide hydrolase-like predicted phosphatase